MDTKFPRWIRRLFGGSVRRDRELTEALAKRSSRHARAKQGARAKSKAKRRAARKAARAHKQYIRRRDA